MCIEYTKLCIESTIGLVKKSGSRDIELNIPPGVLIPVPIAYSQCYTHFVSCETYTLLWSCSRARFCLVNGGVYALIKLKYGLIRAYTIPK